MLPFDVISGFKAVAEELIQICASYGKAGELQQQGEGDFPFTLLLATAR